MVFTRLGLAPPYWQLPAAGMILGAIFGMLAQVLRVNTHSVWQAFCFGCISVWKNWHWILAILVIPLSNLLAAFFTGHKQAYSKPAKLFRPQWNFPGWPAVILCFVVSASVVFSDILLPQGLFGAITSHVHLLLVAATLFFVTSIYDALANQICAGVWIEKCTGVVAVRQLLCRILRPAFIRDAIALQIFLSLLIIVLLLPPIFFAAVFLIYEAPQLEANMSATGTTAPAAFLWCTMVLHQMRGYGWLFIVAPVYVFFSICNAKLFQQAQLQQ